MFSLPDLEATRRAGALLAGVLRGGDVIALAGDLGAGKTTLVDACVRALGGDGASSPTFALVHELRCAALTVWHADLYRIEREAELAELGLDELLGDRRGVAFVEWADKHPQLLPRAYLELRLAHRGAARTLELVGHGARGRSLAESYAQALANP